VPLACFVAVFDKTSSSAGIGCYELAVIAFASEY